MNRQAHQPILRAESIPPYWPFVVADLIQILDLSSPEFLNRTSWQRVEQGPSAAILKMGKEPKIEAAKAPAFKGAIRVRLTPLFILCVQKQYVLDDLCVES